MNSVLLKGRTLFISVSCSHILNEGNSDVKLQKDKSMCLDFGNSFPVFDNRIVAIL